MAGAASATSRTATARSIPRDGSRTSSTSRWGSRSTEARRRPRSARQRRGPRGHRRSLFWSHVMPLPAPRHPSAPGHPCFRPVLAVLAAAALVAPRLAAQLPEADAAFKRGDYRAARAAYERVLAADSTNVRALHQLAVLDSWDGKVARSSAWAGCDASCLRTRTSWWTRRGCSRGRVTLSSGESAVRLGPGPLARADGRARRSGAGRG